MSLLEAITAYGDNGYFNMFVKGDFKNLRINDFTKNPIIVLNNYLEAEGIIGKVTYVNVLENEVEIKGYIKEEGYINKNLKMELIIHDDQLLCVNAIDR